jgi:cell division ATPase FtsA
MHHYVDSAFLDLNSRLENIQQIYSQTVVNTDEVRKIVREEAFCLQETERRKTNIIVKNLPKNKNVDDLSEVKQILEMSLNYRYPLM